MVKYQKRQLPPLQRYDHQGSRNLYNDYNASEWDGYDYGDRRQPRYNNSGALIKTIWKKFLITFGGLSVLVCVSWVAYNCGSGGSKGSSGSAEPVVIEPETTTFKVLPENHGGIEIPHQDKRIYDKISSNKQALSPAADDDRLLPAQESADLGDSEDIAEYSIIDDRAYYIKLATNKSKKVLDNELAILKNKYAHQISKLSCEVKTIKAPSGEKNMQS